LRRRACPLAFVPEDEARKREAASMRLIKLIVGLAVAGVDVLAAATSRLIGRRTGTHRVVLYYHAIPIGSRHLFAAQMDQLMRVAEPVSIESIESSERLDCGRRCAAITFDDAFVSVVDNALPELRARGIPCTIFVPTGSLGRHPGWIGSSHPDAGEMVISRDLLRAIALDHLVGFGSHSVTHPNFHRLDDAQAREELSRSKAALEELLERPVQSFSFPHGAYTPRSLELALECGYTRVFTIEPERLNGVPTRFAVGRVRVEPTDWPIEFHLKAIGAYRWIVHASALTRRLVGLMRGPQAHAGRVEQSL
jgi:peptidoglycan/xylan/chitin deacetylase (PgdA/CDA1 family)